MIKAIVFDCFGVLVSDALNEIVVEVRKTDSQKADRIVGLIHKTSKGHLGRMEARLAIATELDITLDEYNAAMQSNEVKNHDLIKFIKSLRRKYKTALLSNVSHGGLEVRFPDDELHDYFDVIVASAAVGMAKPENEIYQLTADKLGVSINECVMIDDNVGYYKGATAAGMHAILFKSNEQLKTELSALLKP